MLMAPGYPVPVPRFVPFADIGRHLTGQPDGFPIAPADGLIAAARRAPFQQRPHTSFHQLFVFGQKTEQFGIQPLRPAGLFRKMPVKVFQCLYPARPVIL